MGVHGRLRAIKCRGLKKEGGNLLRGTPPTKKLQRFTSAGAFVALFANPDTIGGDNSHNQMIAVARRNARRILIKTLKSAATKAPSCRMCKHCTDNTL